MPKTGDHPLFRLIGIMARLRDPETGCPWDVEQTFETIAPYTIEEAYEVADAIERGEMGELKEELGDLLFVCANLARKLDADPEQVLRAANAKFTRRFNHIEARLAEQGRTPDQSDLAEMDRLWDEAKARERSAP